MSTMDFGGRVAIVTGAGGNPGLGRAHAMILASRGARVVVNDLGVGPDGRSVVPADATQVVAEIIAAGGEAVVDLHSVADETEAKKVVQTALDWWGRVDILVNNAGIGVVSDFDEIESGHIEKVIGVHLMGSIWMCRAVWPHMRGAGYGRIVNTTSGAMWGLPGLTVYGTAKFGVYGLTRGLALEGGGHGIRVNAISPGGVSNSFHHFYTINDPRILKAFLETQPAELVSPVVAYLAHEECELTGGLFDVTAGSVVARLFGTTAGYSNRNLTMEDVRDNLDQILDASTFVVATDPRDATQTGNNDLAKLIEAKPYQRM
jgi:NAD(P)-dependent dehydrogenase (short-subunit alcohol dehydrogenase family)